MLYVGYNGQGDPRSGTGYELNAIAAAVVGSCSLAGGQGTLLGAVLGAAILNVILNGINLIIQKNASLWEGTIVGSVVILAVLLNVLGSRRQFAGANFKVTSGEWHELKVECVGNKIICYYDGQKKIEATDDTFKDAGKMGLWTKADSLTYFDDLHVIAK